jgi:glycosyltransferase involved in cell wall biosynthesis
MANKKMSICFVTINGSPDFLGGYSIYHKNLIEYIKTNNVKLDVSWVYFGKENRTYDKEGVHYFELKLDRTDLLVQIKKNFLLANFFKENYFDTINSIGGIWTFFYKKKKNQKIIQTFHGTVYYFNKNQLKRLNMLKRILSFPILPLSWMLERPHKETDSIICVSEKVKKQVESLYGKRKNIFVIRTGVNLNNFKPRDKNKSKKKLDLDMQKNYGLYVGGGGYWGKGLDRAIRISEEIYNEDKNYRLIVIGADYKKIKEILHNKQSIIFLENVPREKMPLYYSASDVFFCVSRYEGGAPTLVTSEAMASGCLLVCSKDSEQEIVEDKKNCLIFENFDKEYAEKIINILKDKKNKNIIINNSIKTIKELSLEKWGEKTLKYLLS